MTSNKKLFINTGSSAAKTDDILTALGVNPTDVVGIEVKERCSFITVKDEAADQLVAKAKAGEVKIGERKLVVDFAREQGERPAKPERKPASRANLATELASVVRRPADIEAERELATVQAELARAKGELARYHNAARKAEEKERAIAYLGGEAVKQLLVKNAISLLHGRQVGENSESVTDEDRRFFVGSPARAQETLAQLRYALDCLGMKAERIKVEKALEAAREEDKKAAKSVEAEKPLATIGDAIAAKQADSNAQAAQ